MNDLKKLGVAGENFVALFLEKQGYTILAQNYTSVFGEIDIIAQKGECVAFVEVKTRKALYFPIASVVNHAKQRKIIRTAKFFLMEYELPDKVFRFDVATVLCKNEQLSCPDDYKIDYIENAFYGQ